MKRRKFLSIMRGTSVVVSLASVLAHDIKSHAQQLSGALAESFRRRSREVDRPRLVQSLLKQS